MTRLVSVKFLFIFCLILTGLPGVAQAGQSIWNHNGSQMLLESSGNQRVISYYIPRRGISAQPGQILFRGFRNGQTYEGTAYTFRRGCAPAPYPVSGVLSSEYNIVLHGASPKRSGCQITGYTRKSGNATLAFTYIRKIADQGALPPLDPGFGDPQEGPIGGPAEIHKRLIPGGEITFRVQDEDAPASTPIRIDVSAQCVSGRSHQLLSNYRTCAFDSLTSSADGKSFIMNMRNFGGSSCSQPLSLPVYVDELCR